MNLEYHVIPEEHSQANQVGMQGREHPSNLIGMSDEEGIFVPPYTYPGPQNSVTVIVLSKEKHTQANDEPQGH